VAFFSITLILILLVCKRLRVEFGLGLLRAAPWLRTYDEALPRRVRELLQTGYGDCGCAGTLVRQPMLWLRMANFYNAKQLG